MGIRRNARVQFLPVRHLSSTHLSCSRLVIAAKCSPLSVIFHKRITAPLIRTGQFVVSPTNQLKQCGACIWKKGGQYFPSSSSRKSFRKKLLREKKLRFVRHRAGAPRDRDPGVLLVRETEQTCPP